MKCKKCGQEFEGKFCPNCGTPANAEGSPPAQQEQPTQPTPQPVPPVEPPKKKKKGCLTAALIVIGIIVVIIIIAQSCGGGGSTPTAVTSAGSTASGEKSSETQSDASEPEKTVFKVGETVKYNDVELTVTDFKTTKGGEYDSPEDGNEYAVVTVKYKNVGKENVSYNPYDFKIKNSKGQITDQAYLSTLKNDLRSGDLAPGGEVEGTIAFEAPKGDKGLVLQYTGNIFESESEIDFKLN